MDFEQLKKTWQEQPVPDKVTVQSELLLKMSRRDQQCFLSAVLRRDILEVSVCLLLVVYFLHNYAHSKSISMLIVGLGCLFVGGFFIIDRVIQKKRSPQYEDTLRCCLEQSLNQVNHQIWLLRNILWWYILPVCFGMFVGPFLERGMATLTMSYLVVSMALFLVFYGIYRLNQHAVLYGLFPYRNEIQNLLNQLDSKEMDSSDIKPVPPYTKTNKFIDRIVGILYGIGAIVGIWFVASSLLIDWTQRQALNINDFSNRAQHIARMRSDPKQAHKPIVIEARYGWHRRWVDVTEIVVEKVDNNEHPILATNNLAGDPCPGQVKSLVVHYIYQGEAQTAQVQEIQPLILPSVKEDP